MGYGAGVFAAEREVTPGKCFPHRGIPAAWFYKKIVRFCSVQGRFWLSEDDTFLFYCQTFVVIHRNFLTARPDALI